MSNLSSIFGGSLDLTNIEPQNDFDILPPGPYAVKIDKAEVKQTKARDGHYLKVTMTVLEGPGKNRKLWDNINVDNPSQQCVDIGRRQLSALGHAVGITIVNDENQFLGKTCIAHVKIKDNQNEIRTYSAMTQQTGVQQLPVAPQATGFSQPAKLQPESTAIGAPSAPPWARQ